MSVADISLTRVGRWILALGFVVFWYALLQGISFSFFSVAPDLETLPLDLLVNLLLGALLYAISRSLRTFLAAEGVLLTALYLSNAGKIAVLGAPIMPDDFFVLHNLFLLLHGWKFIGAVTVIVLPGALLLLMLDWRSRRAWATLGLMAGLASVLVLRPGVSVAVMDVHIGNTVWNQRGNFEERGLLLHLVQESVRYLEKAGSPPSAGEVASALISLNGEVSPGAASYVMDVGARRKRNVHVIVLESFWDPAELKAAGLSDDPVDPRFRALWRSAGNGRAMSPVFGGYTANAEFETLCGFPVTEDAVFFEGRLRRDVPCLPRHLAVSGYRTIASHPNVAAFWNRVNAYRRIGFDTYWSESDFVLDDMNREFLSDRSLYRQVMEKIRPILASDQPVFNYVLTFFGHLDYPLNAARPHQIDVDDANPLLDSFANTIYYKSRELMNFLIQLRQEDPDAVVVLFGDHLPFLGQNFAGYVESGLLAANREDFDQAMVQRSVSTPMVVIDGRRGPLVLPDMPMFGIPGLILDLLQDTRPAVMRLIATDSRHIVRPLPGMHWVSQDGLGRLCRQQETAPSACVRSGAWLEAVTTLTRDLFGGEQHLLQTPLPLITLASRWPQSDPATAEF